MNAYGELINPGTVRFERLLPGPAERVWAYITDGDRRAEWLCAGDYDQRQGGRVEMIFDNSKLSVPVDAAPPDKYREANRELRMYGSVLRCEPPRLFEHTWIFGDEDSIVCYELEPAGGQVRLILTHTRLESKDSVLSVSGGWHTHLEMLEAVLREAPLPRFWASFRQLEAEYSARFSLG